jgi:hypothetical protein
VNSLPGGPHQSAKKIGNSSIDPYGINADLAPVLDAHRSEGDLSDEFEFLCFPTFCQL